MLPDGSQNFFIHRISSFLLFSGEVRQAFDGIDSDRAGVKSADIHRSEGDKEYIALQFIQIFQDFEKRDVLCHADIMERLNVFVAVFDGNTVAEANAFHMMVDKPLSRITIDKEAFVLLCIGFRGEGWQRINGIKDYDVAFAHLLTKGAVQQLGSYIGVRFHIGEFHIQPSSHKGGERQGRYIRPLFPVVIGAFAMSSQMAHQVHVGMKIGDRPAGIKTVQGASPGFLCGVYQLGEVNNAVVAENIAV
jgi:hypothetical protein